VNPDSVDVKREEAGFFGKLPLRGDFINRGLPRTFMDGLDAWLRGAIQVSRERLGEQWLDRYLTSPLWRFALGAGACGDGAYAGVLMPSVDRVGRYFPLAIAAPVSQQQGLLSLTAAPWYETAEAVALGGLDDGCELEDFIEAVRALGLPCEPVTSPPRPRSGLCGSDWYCPLGDLSALSEARDGLADLLLARWIESPTLWWSQGSEHIDPCLLICRGLPSGEKFTGLIAGDWNRWGWSEAKLSGSTAYLAAADSKSNEH
jgi:type VI secretion system protein ImpM